MYEALSAQTQQSYQNVSRETFWYDLGPKSYKAQRSEGFRAEFDEAAVVAGGTKGEGALFGAIPDFHRFFERCPCGSPLAAACKMPA
jgi:hypothetical protein